ncbi:MAG: hypothetical protein KKB65_07670 [Nanoarchaeota archaeon]|nr:hypothetical protein [Nanoarchaeota archaeon]
MDFLKRLKERAVLLKNPKALPDTVRDSLGSALNSNKQQEHFEQKVVEKKEAAPFALPSKKNSDDIIVEKARSFDDSALDLEEPPSMNGISNNASNASNVSSTSDVSNTSNTPEKQGFVKEPVIKEDPIIVYKQSEPLVSKRQYDSGFFSDFETFLKNKNLDEDALDGLMSKDLLQKMKQYHIQKERGKPFFFHKDDLERQITEKLVELKQLEEEWYLKHEELKRTQSLVLAKESEMDSKLEELKELFNHVKHLEKLERKASSENYFVLSEGRELRSLSNLRNSLKLMSEEVFSSHVNAQKNDFASWAEHVFGEKALSVRMRKANSRDELFEVLDNP